MSVLYKALQKAAKDNEQRQAPTVSFDAERLAGSGVIRTRGGRGVSWRLAGAAISVVFIAVMGAAFYLTSSESTQPPKLPITAEPSRTLPPPPQIIPPPRPAPSMPGAPPAVAGATAVSQPQGAASQPSIAGVPAAPIKPQVVAMAPTRDVSEAEESKAPDESTEPPAPEPSKAKAAPVFRTATRQQPMPDIDANSPARMLNPPITIHRNQIDLEGVGNAVQVRRVSQAAQDTVGSAYNALIRGEYDTALGFYDVALKQEPSSVLALLGRGAALQKLGRKDEARQSYESVLKINPGNREALTNLTGLESERAPGDALARLMDLEKEYPNFSPVKAQIGLIYARLENFDGALEYFRRALVVTPDAPLYLYNMALVLDRAGKSEQAVAFYERTLNATVGNRAIPELSVPDIQRRINFLRGR